MMASAQAPSTTLPEDIAAAVENLNAVQRDISRHIVGNEYMIRSTAIAMIAGANIFFQGLPGISKSMLGKLVAQRLNGKFHKVLYGPYLEPEAVFGIQNPDEFMKGRYVRAREGSILEANVHFADEVFEMSDAMKKTLLGVFDETPTFEEMGNSEVLDDLLLVMSASNRLPGPEDAAFGDRLVFQLPVAKPAEREDRKEILLRHLREGTGELSSEPQAYISIPDVKRLRAFSRANVSVPDGVAEKLLSLDYELEEHGIYVSPRTANRCLDILRATALLDGRTIVKHQDILVLQYVVAPIPQQAEVRDLIYNLVAPLEKTALDIFAALKDEVGTWRALANNPDKRRKTQALTGGQDVLNNVLDYKEQLDELAQQAEKEGYDTEAITNMAGQVGVLKDSISKRIRELYRETASNDDK